MRNRFIEAARAIGLLSVILLLSVTMGCNRGDSPQSQQTQAPLPAQTFAQVQLGMTSQQVRQVVGEPRQIKQKGQKVEWEYWTQQGKFEVELINDRVVSIETH